jgi:hypothetical protein
MEDIQITTEVAKVLEEYLDVIPNELPNGIPHVVHEIDYRL